MLGIGAKLLRAATIGGSTLSHFRSSQLPLSRFFSNNNNNVNTGFKTNPVALQMINYALSLARTQKSDESYAQAQLILEQCHSTQSDESTKGLVFLAMSTLFSERGNFGEAIEKLQKVQDSGLSSLAVRVAASEALAGRYLESYQDDSSSTAADMCLQLLESIRLEIGGGGSDILETRAKALKGLVELVHGNVESGEKYSGQTFPLPFVLYLVLRYSNCLCSFQPSHALKELKEVKVALAMLHYLLVNSCIVCGISKWRGSYIKRPCRMYQKVEILPTRVPYQLVT